MGCILGPCIYADIYADERSNCYKYRHPSPAMPGEMTALLDCRISDKNTCAGEARQIGLNDVQRRRSTHRPRSAGSLRSFGAREHRRYAVQIISYELVYHCS